ncbi:MAG: DoxX family protein [Actinomycetota bacterium]|nr:DoxX family protein [Actinomycetota bacterium]
MKAGRQSRWPRAVGLVFTVAGLLHFVRPGTYESIMPDELPAQRELVYVSGVAELAGGLGLLHPRTRRWAGWWLIATLIAVLPANVHMAVRAERYPQFPPAALWARVPLQLVFIAAVWRALRAPAPAADPPGPAGRSESG